MSVLSRKRKKCSGTCRGSCKPIAVRDGEALVRPDDVCLCEGYGTAAGTFVLMRRREKERWSLPISFISVAFFMLFSYVYALTMSKVSTLDLVTSFLAFAGTVLFLTSLEALVAVLLVRLKGGSLRASVIAVPSPLPSLLPLFEVEEEVCKREDYSNALGISLLVSSLVAVALSTALGWIKAYPKVKVGLLFVAPASIAWIPGMYGPVVAGASAFMLSALFQLTFYPYSPSWALLGFSNPFFPLLIGLSLAFSSPGLGVVLSGYVLVSALLSIFAKERPAWKDPFSGPGRLGTVATLITLLLVALVG